MNDTSVPAQDVNTETSIIADKPGLDDLDFYPLTQLNLHPFNHALLKLGQFLTAKEPTKREITETNLSRMMFRFFNQLHIRPYSAKEIREQLNGQSGEFRGGGVLVEWSETSSSYGRSKAHYTFSFSQIYRLEDLVVKTEPRSKPGFPI